MSSSDSNIVIPVQQFSSGGSVEGADNRHSQRVHERAAWVLRFEAEGFSVWYEGKGNWEAAFDEWPWSADAVVYAARA